MRNDQTVARASPRFPTDRTQVRAQVAPLPSPDGQSFGQQNTTNYPSAFQPPVARSRVASSDLMDFEVPVPEPRVFPQQTNIHPRVPRPSILERDQGDRIAQPVMRFTVEDETPQPDDDDVTMTDGETNSQPPKKLTGLAASRWNPKNRVQFREQVEDRMSVDTPPHERRGPARPTGRIVTSGNSRKPGLADSRWAN
ncbi:hypothetical protein F4677DRAFT_424487 [Hypoxylon crocopeplum]|nr:hypothetical protein F4677DRAFT_424487 [Hypoxylon crocopeplum]